MFDSDKFGKDKSLGRIEFNPQDLDPRKPTWLPLKGVKSGELLLNTELLAPGQQPAGYDPHAQPVQGRRTSAI